MPSYHAPVKDVLFLLNDVFGIERYNNLPGFADASSDVIEAILTEADDVAARRVLEVVGLDSDDERSRAVVRAYGGLAKAAVREWQRSGALSRDDVHLLLTRALFTIVRDVLPETPVES